jgi:hypothetical protein
MGPNPLGANLAEEGEPMCDVVTGPTDLPVDHLYKIEVAESNGGVISDLPQPLVKNHFRSSIESSQNHQKFAIGVS